MNEEEIKQLKELDAIYGHMIKRLFQDILRPAGLANSEWEPTNKEHQYIFDEIKEINKILEKIVWGE